MIIKSIRVQNFRCIRDEILPCESLTALIGPNSSGKSSFLRALDIFYTPTARYTEDDFYNRDTSQDIVVTVTFADLTEDEKKLFQKYVESGGLTVEKVMKWPPNRGSQKYYGTSLQNSEFSSFRSASGANLRVEYNKLLRSGYSDLSGYTNKDDAEEALQGWEESHPEQCIRRQDEGQFFGFKEVGEAHLERFTRFILVPAVRNASEDATEGKGTSLTEIMDLVVRSVLAQQNKIIELQKETQKQYERIVDPTKLVELQTLEQNLSDTLKIYVPDVKVKLTWLSENVIDIPMPKADIKLMEDKYLSPVESTGHGLQRALILTMLQHLAIAQVQESVKQKENSIDKVSKETHSLKTPNLILGIDEPELYQHPNRQRHLSKILLKLAEGSIKEVANRTQIIYSTHSPLFVDINRLAEIRVLHKVRKERDKPKQTKIVYTNLDEVAKIIEKADGKPEGTYTGKTLEPRLKALMTPWMNEGFFADVAVLVEGEEDRAAILGVAAVMEYDLEGMGISVIPCMGKNNLDRPAAIFRELQIPIYVIWDSDYDGNKDVNPENNYRLLRLFDQPIEKWPEKITGQFACFKRNLSYTLRKEIGEQLYNKTLETCCKEWGITRKKYAVKNPRVIQKIIKEAQRQGKSSETLKNIISKVVDIRRP